MSQDPKTSLPWIRMADQLPPIGETVLVRWGQHYDLLARQDDTYLQAGSMLVNLNRVSHWLRLVTPI